MDVDVFGFTKQPNNHSEESAIICYYFFLVSALTVVIYYTMTSFGKRLDLAIIFLWIPICPVMCYWAYVETRAHFFGSSSVRLLQVTPEGASFMRLYIALQILGVLTECQISKWQAGGWKSQLLVVAHHTLSGISYCNGIYGQRWCAMAAALGLCEVSTIFLNILLLCKHDQFKTYMEKNFPWVTVASGICLWSTFIVFRLLLFPYCFYQWMLDLTSGKALATGFEAVFYTLVIAFLFFLSAYWFQSIHKGMMKAIFGGGASETEKKGKKGM